MKERSCDRLTSSQDDTSIPADERAHGLIQHCQTDCGSIDIEYAGVSANRKPVQFLIVCDARSYLIQAYQSDSITDHPLSEQPLGVRVQVRNTALCLCTGRPQLESKAALVGGLLQQLNRHDTGVLQRMLKTGVEIRNELGEGTLVDDISRDTLSDLDGVGLREVSRGGGIMRALGGGSSSLGLGLGPRGALLGVLHGFDRAHAPVGLDSLAVVVEVLSRRFGRTGQHTAHHHSRCTERECLGDVTDVLDTTICDGGNAESGGEFGNGVDGGTLRSTDSHDFLGDTDGSGTHTDSKTVRTGDNEFSGLFSSDDVACYDFELGEGLLDPLDEFDLVDRVTLRRVENDDVKTSLNEQFQSVLVGLSSTDGGTTVELLGLWELGSEREVLVLEQIRTGQEGDEVSIVIDDRELSLLAVPQDGVGLLQRNSGLTDDEVGGHDVLERSSRVSELDVSAGHDTEEFGACLTSLSDGQTAESSFGLDVQGVLDRGFRRKADGVGDESVLVLLDFSDHERLLFGGAVVVDDTETAVQRDGDGHLGLRDGVHGRGHEGSVKDNLLGDLGKEGNIRGGELDLAGQ